MRETRVGPGPIGTAIMLLVLLGTLLLGPTSARAKTTVEQLQKEIRQRDAMIRSLVRRVENLERQMGSSISANASPAAAARPATRSRPAGGQIQSAPSNRSTRSRRRRHQEGRGRPHPPNRRSKRALLRRRPGSSRSARTMRSAHSSGRSLPQVICWFQRVLLKSSRCSATFAGRRPTKFSSMSIATNSPGRSPRVSACPGRHSSRPAFPTTLFSSR
jgi:hypothetical protein